MKITILLEYSLHTILIKVLRNKIKSMDLDSNLLDAISMADIPLEEGGFSLPLSEDELK